MDLNHLFLSATEAARVLPETTKLNSLPSKPVAVSGLFMGGRNFPYFKILLCSHEILYFDLLLYSKGRKMSFQNAYFIRRYYLRKAAVRFK